MTTASSQAWAILARHARDEISPLRLQELCRDNDRVSSLVAVYNTTTSVSSTTNANNTECHDEDRILIADLSRQRMTLDTVNHLLKLASAKGLRQFIRQLAWGQNNPNQPILPKGKQREHSTQQVFNQPQLFPADGDASKQQLYQQQSMHMALRVPAGQSYEMLAADGTNVLTAIHQDWQRWKELANSIRLGQVRGVSGSMIHNVIVVGQGLPLAALQFLDQALRRDERAVLASRAGLGDTNPATRMLRRNLTGLTALGQQPDQRRLHFLTRVDPVAAASVVSDLEPGSTLVISIALNGNEETGLATKTLKSWLLQALMGPNKRPDHILAKHMMLVTGNDRIASVINKPESVFLVPEHSRCEGFSTFSAATILPLSIVFGWSIVEQFLGGAHDMDKHFLETNPRHNIPVLLALADVWNDTLLGASTRVMTPFSECFKGYPAFCAALEAQTCCRTRMGGLATTTAGQGTSSLPSGMHKATCSSLVTDGGVDGTYDRSIYQSKNLVNSELIAVMDNQIHFNTARTIGANNNMAEVYAAQDAVICSLFAHCDELAFGSERADNLPSTASLTSNLAKPDIGEALEGNRASMLLMCGKLDAFTCGQLVALAEHRAVVKAHLWGVDPFVQEVGSSLRANRTDNLKDELQHLFSRKGDESGGVSALGLSTKTILEHYAQMMQDTRSRR